MFTSNKRQLITILSSLCLCCTLWLPGWTAQAPSATSKPEYVALAEQAFAREDWPGAAQHFRSAIEQGFDNPLIQMRLGFALHMQGKYEDAMPHHLRAAAARHPEIRIDGLYNAACANARLGNTELALELLMKAVDAGFRDTTQIERDEDMNSLRADERFKRIAAGIGKEPTLHQWMDFFIGTWEQHGPEPEKPFVESLTISRPHEGGRALQTLSRNAGGGNLTGLLWPDAQSRQWRWVIVDQSGSIQEFTGACTEDGAMIFHGRERTPVGPGAHVRLSYRLKSEGIVMEKVESSADGEAWRTHREAAFIRKP